MILSSRGVWAGHELDTQGSIVYFSTTYLDLSAGHNKHWRGQYMGKFQELLFFCVLNALSRELSVILKVTLMLFWKRSYQRVEQM
jgi:hypothetical protein